MSEKSQENLPNPDNAEELANAIKNVENALPSNREKAEAYLKRTKLPETHLPKHHVDKEILIDRNNAPNMIILEGQKDKHQEFNIISNPNYNLPTSDAFIEHEIRDILPENSTFGFLQKISKLELEELKKKDYSSEEVEKTLDMIEDTAIKMEIGSEINKIDQEKATDYLETKIYRWDDKAEDSEDENKRSDYEAVSDYFTSLKEKVEGYKNVKDEELEQEMKIDLDETLKDIDDDDS